ncbi:MAG: hypothetical protein SYC29_02840, partial [Planctomycetota bacterium]|nr:hypothetical protein [Planctomycetota bacterium]
DSWMTRAVGGGEISFWYRVSSEAGYDFFNFSIDGEQHIHASGTGGPWTHFSIVLEPGSHELRWEYDKDQSVSHGSDTVWIDDLEIVDDLTEWNDIIEFTAPGVMEAEWTPTEESENCKVRVRAYYESSHYGAWDESDDVFEVGEGSSCPADFDGDGDVDTADLLYLLAAWGTGDGDVDGDGDTDTADLLALLANWGQCP